VERPMTVRVMSGVLGAALAVGLIAIPTAGAAAKPVSVTKTIVANADTYVNSIRDYFFCQTATCKKNKATEKSAAASGMTALVNEATAASTATIPSSQKAVVAKFINDVELLANAYLAYPKESSSGDIARNTGLLYYQSANVGSDAYLLSTLVNGGKVAYVPWSVGAVAVLYAMQLDAQALNAKSATVAQDVFASQDLQSEAASLLTDANGPSASFNALIKQFATIQLQVSAQEIRVLEGKKASLSSSKISALGTQLGTLFSKIVASQKALSK